MAGNFNCIRDGMLDQVRAGVPNATARAFSYAGGLGVMEAMHDLVDACGANIIQSALVSVTWPRLASPARA